MDLAAARRDSHDTLLHMVSSGLVIGSAGNASVRLDDSTIVVSAGGVPYSDLGPDDHPLVDLHTGATRVGRAPTSELALHLALHRAAVQPHGGLAPLNAVVHTHSPHVAGFSVARVDLEFVCNENIGSGRRAHPGDLAVLAAGLDRARRRCRGHPAAPAGLAACLLANHGPVAIGGTLSEALLVAQQVEWIAQVSHVARTWAST